MHSFHYRDGRLCCEEVDLTAVAEEHGTPLYVYSAATVLDHFRRLNDSLGQLPHLICYAVKANTNRAILRLLADEGSGFDIVSGGELFRVIHAGGDPMLCTFAGVGKTREEIEYALDQRVYSFNVESEAELELINRVAAAKKVRAPIALRVNPDVEASTHKYISTGKSENMFGLGLERVGEVYAHAARMENITIRGVQMHIGSQISKAEPFAAAIAKIAPLAVELKQKYAIEFCSIGGGMGIVYEGALASGNGSWWSRSEHDSAFSVKDYAAAVVPAVEKLGLRVLLEPGRFLVGNAGVLLTQVQFIKQTPQKRFVIVDGGMNDLIRPALYQSYHEIVPVREARPGISSKSEPVDIVGPVCESGDFFAQDRAMPPVGEGDLLAVMSAGAYGFVMSSNYNSRPFAAEVLVHGGDASLIRERQTIEELIRGEIDPQS